MQYSDEYEVEPEGDEFIASTDLPNFTLHPTEFDEEHPELEEDRLYDTVTPTYVVPEVVKQFVSYFHRHIKDRNVYDIYSMYENTFNKITDKYFKHSPWPPAESISALVHHDQVFLILYKELYYRHIYAKLQPTMEHRFESFKNYCDFFNFIINAPSDLNLDLPNQWLWDIIDEFIYQYQAFCQYRTKLKNKPVEELNLLKNNPQLWNVNTVINYLQALVTKSNIVQILEREKSGNHANEAPIVSHQLYKMLGYFSLVGLLRVHCLLGDFYLALKSVAPIELTTKGLFTKVTACHITLYYFLGFVYMMMRRYVDAIRTFASNLLYISRTKQYHTRSYQFEQIMKKSEQMYALLAICISLCPQRVDENVHATLRDKFGDKMQKMQRGEEPVFEELFAYACPKFINPASPPYAQIIEDPSKAQNYSQESVKLQSKLFLNEVRQQTNITTIRSFLKLYTTIGTQKLADFLDMDAKTFRTQLLCYKHKARGLVWNGGAPASGEVSSYSDVDFYVDQDMVHINDTKVARRYSEFFVRHTEKLLNLLGDEK